MVYLGLREIEDDMKEILSFEEKYEAIGTKTDEFEGLFITVVKSTGIFCRPSFQNLVWGALQAIPYGQTCSYQDLADAIGKPSAIRAVANANGHNRIAVIIPCHRVIGADGNPRDYGGGIERKRQLLNLESKYQDSLP